MHALREAKAKEVLDKQPNITLQELAEILGISARNVANSLAWRMRPVHNRSGGYPRQTMGLPQQPTANEWLDHCAAASRLEKRASRMSHPCPALYKMRDDVAGIVLFGDQHMGSLYTDHPAIARDLELIKSDPRLYALMLGDGIQCTLNGFPDAESVHAQSIAPHRQLDLLVAMIESIRGKTVAYLCGNHDQRIEKVLGVDLVAERIAATGTAVYNGPAILHVSVGKEKYDIVAAHKFPGRTALNPVGAALGLYRRFCPSASLAVTGHVHQPAMLHFRAYDTAAQAGCGIGGDMIAAVVGTAQGLGEPYGQRFGDGGLPATMVVVFHGRARKVVGFWCIEDAVAYMNGLPKAPDHPAKNRRTPV